MRQIKSTDELKIGEIVLTGMAYYRITDVFPGKFRGNVWQEKRKGWGPLRDVALPSMLHSAYIVPPGLFLP